MELNDYQQRAMETDQFPNAVGAEIGDDARNEIVVPMMGLVGEVGTLLAEYKKHLRDGASYRRFHDGVEEELGDILWYVSNIATKFGIALEKVAESNLAKVGDRWAGPVEIRPAFDEGCDPAQQLPREFDYRFTHRDVDGAQRLVLLDHQGNQVGDSLSDNTYEDDGYRYHDVMHLAFAAHFGWSPVIRKLLRKANRLVHRGPAAIDDAEDGGRAQVIEEGIVAAVYAYAADHELLEGIDAVDWRLLGLIRDLVAKLEVKVVTGWEWNRAIIEGFQVWRQLIEHKGGRVRTNMATKSITFEPLAPEI